MKPVARWDAGPHHGLVWPGGVALLEASMSSEVVERVWREADNEPGDLAHFVTALSTATGHDLLDLPGFAVALLHRDSVQLAARGDFLVEIGPDAAMTVSGRDVTTWSEARVKAPADVRLSHADDDGDRSPSQFALLAGTAPVMTITAHLSADPSSLDATSPAAERHEPAPPPAPAPLDDVHQGEADLADNGEARALDEEDAEFSHLWSEFTTYQRVEDAAIRSTESQPGRPAPTPAPAAVEDPGQEVTRVGDEDEDVTLSREPKDEQPAASGHLPPPRLDGPSLRSPGQDVETVVGRAAVTSSREEPPPTVASARGVACPQGHANPPDQAICRVCGDPVTGEVVDLPRPSLGRLVSSEGTTIELTGPVIVGREPRAARFQGTEIPQLVQLPHAHVSANHVEFRVDGWQVLAVDLRSTNGTFLRRPGAAPVRMTSTPVPVSAGDQIDLGHGVLLTLESP